MTLILLFNDVMSLTMKPNSVGWPVEDKLSMSIDQI